MANKAGRGSDQFMVRLPDGMRENIREAAEQAGRSMNAEIVARLVDYPRLLMLEPLVAFGDAERKRLANDVANLTIKLSEAEGKAKALQHLMSLDYKEAKEQQETLDLVGGKVDEMLVVRDDIVDQRSLLVALRDELLSLLNDKDADVAEREALLTQQTALIEKLNENVRTSTKLLSIFRDAFLEAADGDDSQLKVFMDQFGKKSNPPES